MKKLRKEFFAVIEVSNRANKKKEEKREEAVAESEQKLFNN